MFTTLRYIILASISLQAMAAAESINYTFDDNNAVVDLNEFTSGVISSGLSISSNGGQSQISQQAEVGARAAGATMQFIVSVDANTTLNLSSLSFKHAFRNSLIVIVTLVGNLLPAMIGGSVIVEFIFSINGMGKLGFDAILSRDYPTIMAITTFSAFLTLMGILISDILYGVVDPRVVQK